MRDVRDIEVINLQTDKEYRKGEAEYGLWIYFRALK